MRGLGPGPAHSRGKAPGSLVTMECRVCHHVNDASSRFCVSCGSSLDAGCPNCGLPVAADQNFCGNCGFDLKHSAPERASPATYTPTHLAQRILDERHLVVGERKLVTVLFADIVGSTAAIEHVDPEEAATYLTESLGAMMDAVHLFEGTVNELRGDGIMALFGAPIAHEDHAVRACRAALEIPEAVARATDGVSETRVGIHTGEVLVREVGNDLSVEYQALGPTVHLASRMETLAEPGTAYVTGHVRRLIEGALEFRDLGPRAVKGISEPVRVYQLIRALDATPWETRASRGLTVFTGRDRELARIHTALDEVDAERGRVVAILGEAGVGKSRLVHEFLRSGAVDGFRVIKSGASPFDSNTSYYPIKHAIHGWLGTEPGAASIAPTLRAALRDLDPELEQTAAALAALLDSPVADPQWVEATPNERRRGTRNAVRALVGAFARIGPVVIVVEDLHWIDGETQTVLDDLVDLAASTQLMMILTHRPDYSDAWASKAHVQRIHLEALPTGPALELLGHLVGNDPTVAELKPLIAARSEGTPLFLEEIVRSLVDSGTLMGTPGQYRSGATGHELRIPDSVQAVLAARIDRLPPAVKHILQLAALAGSHVELPLLAAVADRPESEMVAAVSELRRREFLYEERVLPVAVYGFSHALVRDVAYQSLPVAQRKELHSAMVAAIEGMGGAEHEAAVERLAFHAVRGGLGKKAVAYATQAADKAIERSAYRDAGEFLRDALRVLAELPQEKDVIEQGIDLRMRMRVASTGGTGGLKRSLADLSEALDMAEQIDDLDRQGLLAIHYGYAANMLGDVVLAIEQSHRAEEMGRQLGNRYLEIEGRILRAQSLDYSGQPRGVEELLRPDFDYLSAELRYETMGQTMIRSVVAGAHLGMAGAAMGNFADATTYEDAATAIAAEAGRPFDQMYMHFASGMRLDFQGRAAAAVEAHRRSAAIAEEYDLWFMTTFAQPWLGHALISADRAQEALELLRRLEAAALRVELPYVAALSQAFAAQASQRLGNPADTQEHAAAALEFDAVYPNPVIELVARTALGRLDPGSATGTEHLQRAATIATDNELRPWLADLFDDLGHAQEAAGLRSELGIASAD